jgi:hypothetical protein
MAWTTAVTIGIAVSDVGVKTWIERIDDKAECACCQITETDRGAVYGASTILLFRLSTRTPWTDRRDARRDVEVKLRREIAAGRHRQYGDENRHGLPRIGRVRDLRRS